MLKQNLKCARQAGFTLVELAIVMIIIGLLIGGVLKGQELVANAQVTATISQIKGIDSATTTFRDIYSTLPGDLTNPTQRLPGCAAGSICAGFGNGDGSGRVTPAAGVSFVGAPSGEQIAYWAHLTAADLLTGINPAAGAAGLAWGADFPTSKIGGGFHMGYFAGGAAPTNAQLGTTAGAAAAVRAGHYLALHSINAAGASTAAAGMSPAGFLTPSQAARIDTKMDDNVPGSGSVLAAGAPACVNGALYNEVNAGSLCNLYIRIQN